MEISSRTFEQRFYQDCPSFFVVTKGGGLGRWPELSDFGYLLRAPRFLRVEPRTTVRFPLDLGFYFPFVYRVAVLKHPPTVHSRHWDLEPGLVDCGHVANLDVELYNSSFFSAGLVFEGDIVGVLTLQFEPLPWTLSILEVDDLYTLYAKGDACACLADIAAAAQEQHHHGETRCDGRVLEQQKGENKSRRSRRCRT